MDPNTTTTMMTRPNDVPQEKEETKTRQEVLTYLDEISQSLFYFIQDDENYSHHHDDNIVQHHGASLSDFMDQITSRLLIAGDPLKLSRPIPSSLSPIVLYDSKGRVKPPRIVTKVDVLRNILLSMAPIALDVAARMSLLVVRRSKSIMEVDMDEEKEERKWDEEEKENEDEDENEEDIMTRVFCIFSFWLPIAPQIRQIVVDLFQYSSSRIVLENGMESQSLQQQKQQQRRRRRQKQVFNHPLNGKYIQSFLRNRRSQDDNSSHDDNTNDTLGAVQVWTQAVHCLLEHFAKHGDVKILQDCWNWTNLFCILGYTRDDGNDESFSFDHDMESDEGDGMGNMEKEIDLDEMQHDWSNSPKGWAQRPYSPIEAIRWFAARAVADLLNLTPTSKGVFLKRTGLGEEMVPWVRHPWIILEEETNWQDRLLLEGIMVLVRFGEERKVKVPTAWEIRKVGVPLPETLVHLGQGIVMPRLQTAVMPGQVARYALGGCNRQDENNNETGKDDVCMGDDNGRGHYRRGLVMTETTCRNLALLGTALCTDPYPPPILVCGPRGSGKSSLVRELSKLCNASAHEIYGSSEAYSMDNLLELHVDEETDSKTLLGSYAATDIPGEFTWRPGALTNAVRSGKWVLLEDVESCPVEIQAALVKLLEERILPLGVGKNEKCHPNFRLFGTCTTSSFLSAEKHLKDKSCRRLRHNLASTGSIGKKLLHPGLWRKVHVEPLPYSELQIVSKEMFPRLPQVVSDAALNVFRQLDKSGRLQDNSVTETDDVDTTHHQSTVLNGHPTLGNGRTCSVRDLMKLLARISSTVHFEPGANFCTESQRILCMAECYDIFVGWCPCRNLRRDFITDVLASTWGITATAATRYIETRQPQVRCTSEYVEVGRATITRPSTDVIDTWASRGNSSFADTNYSLRLMESAGVCIAQNEPTLLVGETGCGKTTLIQRLASLSGHDLIVQNLSLQTDSTDLLGGYRPLEIRHIARNVYTDFVRLFCSNFSKSQNAQFLDYVTTAYEKGQWKKLSQCFKRAAKMGVDKMKQLNARNETSPNSIEKWTEFQKSSERFEKQRVACDTGLAFVFTEGALVDAIRTGKWILLDEINLASSETLERLCGLLDDAKSSVTLTEKGDSHALYRHPDFRIFAAMNPATDTGKKDLPSSLRSRFTEIYVDELVDPVELRLVAVQYLCGTMVRSETPLEHTETIVTAVDVYLKCRNLAEKSLVDVGGQRPRYTLRTMCRSLTAARNLITEQKFGIKRALFEGYGLGFEGVLDESSSILLRQLLNDTLGHNLTTKELDHPGPRPRGGSRKIDEFVLMKPFWLKAGPNEQVDWSDASLTSDIPKFVLTKSTMFNLRRLSRTISAGPYPVLLEGPTSAGKTTMVEYLAARLGHKCVRINNHEHTDVQEYTGTYASDSNGKLCFQEGILVQALRRGQWVILDELNLAPSEVLEALNRLLDDNRELYLPEINEVVKPHPSFRLFATQNPSGAYGGRKPLSRAFRNRFVEIHVGDIPEKEMITILELRCKCPPSHAKLLVNVMSSLRKRRSKSGVFRGKDGLITPRDLLRWAGRKAGSKHELATNGYMLLAERLRDEEEKVLVQETIEEQFKVDIDCDELYHGKESESRRKLDMLARMKATARTAGLTLAAIAPTKSLLRLLTLVEKCVEHKEPVLLVGETGCGKTTVVQLMSFLLDRELKIVNCHASTETSDLLGGLRPLRGRQYLLSDIVTKMRVIVSHVSNSDSFRKIVFPAFLTTDDNPIPDDALSYIHILVQQLRCEIVSNEESLNTYETDSAKKRKLDSGASEDVVASSCDYDTLRDNLKEVEDLLLKCNSLFEWVDGPLVRAMREGDLFLLDEMSLAEDAVLERLNSVLEPSRTLVLAEKGGDVSVDETNRATARIKAHEDFRIFATMNPGGDFGKRELSPALRSRFTEIWVPSVTERSDIDLVLGQTLQASLEQFGVNSSLSLVLDDVKLRMLNYVSWYNYEICLRPMSAMNDFALSLRDVLAWARFIVETISKNKELGLWCAFAHGASLMHLDGLGLGTGLHHEQALETKKVAKKYLMNQIPDEHQHIAGFEDECKIDICSGSFEASFGVRPFVIPKGNMDIPQELGFKLNAPTTGVNLRRVLRAMQISKPILLEGSPGVGKTSLISALAAASGHNLVRINLSEQTDISDLMGSDLPMPENNEETDLNGIGGGSFKWCDGALLKAIKNGDWVLLDELNLASQSVLEGLNSCLDHRASVYIPELGQTFVCPPTFRIFAAQNPIAQGGGRKGLPKSFLNRFTKVYVEALSKNDLNDIVTAKFPKLPSDLVEKIILFNYSVQDDIEHGKYGQIGSPWEFNLRDVFRLCELIIHHYELSGKIECAKFSSVVYLQRFRSSSDRAMLAKCYETHFDDAVSDRDGIHVELKDHSVKIGVATLRRNLSCSPESSACLLGREPISLRHLTSALEAVALCVEMCWPCLLVGSPSCGKSSVLKYLAESCNRQMVEIALTPSSDVNELIGSFEQIDATEVESRVIRYLKDIFNYACLILNCNKVQTEILREMSSIYHDLMTDIQKVKKMTTSPLVINDAHIITRIGEFVSSAEKAEAASSVFKNSCDVMLSSVKRDILSLKSSKKAAHGMNTTYFRWYDGILVEALEKGYWLHLENVNFCPSSVLDRLNSLMEFGGNLVLTECGISDDREDGNGTPRIVKPHPDFRLFLSMNPAFGEISRAMRNRCVEVCILAPSVTNIGELIPNQEVENSRATSAETLDALDCLWNSGFRSSALSISVIKMHRKEFLYNDSAVGESQPTRTLGDLASLLMASLQRGRHTSNCFTCQQKVAYEIHDEEFTERDIYRFAVDNKQFQMVENLSFRRVLGQPLDMRKISEDARLLRSIHDDFNFLPLGVSKFNRLFQGNDVKSAFESFAHSLVRNDPRLPNVKSFLTARFINRLCPSDAYNRVSYFEGFSLGMKALSLVATILVTRKRIISDPDLFKAAYIDRLAQIIDEQETYNDMAKSGGSDRLLSDLSAIELSYCIQCNEVDSSQISCPVTPMLYPLFLTLDRYLESVADTLSCGKPSGPLIGDVVSLFTARDRLWKFLKGSPTVLNSPFLSFDETGFLVHWSWLNKRLSTMLSKAMSLNSAQGDSIVRNMCLIVEAIDQAVQCKSSDFRLSNSFWKKAGHPLVPAKAEDSFSLFHLKNVASKFSLLNNEDFGYLRIVSRISSGLTLDQLIHRYHNIFSFDNDQKRDLLNALCMAQWATTDEMSAKTRIETKDYDAAKALKVISSKLYSAAEDFQLKLHSCTIDAEIKTFENELHVDGLTRFQQTCVDDSSSCIIHHSLYAFGKIQLTQLSEFLCMKDEEWIVDTLSNILLDNDDSTALTNLRDIVLPRIKTFISTVISYTIWPMSDLRAYQSLVWAIESATSIRYLFKCCHSTLICTLQRHYWCNSFNDLNVISNVLAFQPFWTKLNDGENSNHYISDKGAVISGIVGLSGVPRMKQNVVTEYFFRLQGFKRISDSASRSVPFLTLENHVVRRKQSQDIVRLIASNNNSISGKASGLQTLKLLTENTIAGLQDFFESEDLFSNLYKACFNEPIDVLPIVKQCKHQTFQKLVPTVLVPLINVCRRLWPTNSSEDVGFDLSLAEVYLGILRFHLFIPSSPLDPGKKPGAKVEQWNRYIKELGSKLLAIRMESGLTTGNFEPDTADVQDTLSTLNYCQRKRSIQERKRVERPSNLPSFFELFQEVKHFADTIASVDNILLLLEDICMYQESESNVSCSDKEVTWQSSAVAFFNRISSKYACYEDVTEPFLAALGMIQKGLRSLLNEKTTKHRSPTSTLMHVEDKLLKYPNVEASLTCDPQILNHLRIAFDNATNSVQESSDLIKIGKNTHVTILLSNLANTCILRERKIIANVQFMRMISQIFEAFADAWNSDSSVVNNGPDPDSSKVEISDQFPDHAVEFQRIFEDVEATENQQSAWLNMLKSEPEDNSDFSITEDHIMFMCDIHREIFSQERNGLNDGLRIKAFVSTYTAAAQLNNILLREFSIGSEAERLSAHCYALGINANTDSGHTINFHSYTRPSLLNEVDFHKDPNSAEVAKAGIPLENLSIRVSQLIRAFPGNSLLVSIGLVVERMRRLDLKKTSLGKMLTGLEVILRKAQDWEQHASKRVSFGEPLENISHLVARWRKLELQSWSTLLNVRDQKHVLQAKKHWIRLYNILLSDTVNSSMKDHVATKVCFPSWILVGQSKKLKNLFTCNIERECKESTQQILKLLDTFILTSGIGQFNERLKIIKTFSEHVRAECDVNIERNIHKLTKAIVLESFVGYYTQFSCVIEKVKVELRKPLENKLKDEVKLAKWDEQSYYALAESAEKSHRKLMMIVHDYEEILDTPVLKILEDHFISGIRVNSEVGPMTSQPTTGIPPNMSMFLDVIPDNEEYASGLVLDHNLTSLRAQNRNWVATLSYFDESKYVLGIPKYAKKMEKLFSSPVTSSALLGSNMAADICNSVFERIDILREKGTKSMKERALVDLFKALKQQGYSSMKWNVPKEIQEMQEIFRIQNPSLEYLQEHHHKTLKKAETYFHRCTLELSRLRSEVQMMGSPYMSKREMDIMVGFSENGLLMLCQQRAIITKAIDDVRNILQLLTVFDVLQEALPHDQTNLVHSIKNFDRRYSITLETIRQTFLMMKTVSTLVEDNRDHSMDLVSIVDSCFTSLNDAYNPYLHKTLITKHTLISVSKAKDAIRSNIENFKSCRIRNEQAMCFPQHIFDPCLDMLHRCLHEVQNCEQSQTCLEQKQSLTFELSAFTKKISDLVASSLVAAQTLHDGSIGFSAETDDDELTAPHTLWDIHTKTLMEWDTLNIGGFSSFLEDLIDGLTRETNINGFCLGSICADACVLVLKVVDKCQQRLCHTLNFYRNTAKFEYIKLRLFRVLVAKGYCADEVEESGDCNGGGGEGNMKFEDDVEGTGMGEGEGKNDVTDQIENEEQLLGLKGDEKNENKKEQKQLDENEAETGMEMENEFEGEMFDVPDKKDTEDANNEEEEEELDREMGDGRDPNEQVVDEKMWDDEDEDGDPNGEEEKFEKDSKVSGEALKDEMRTKEDDEKDCNDEGNDNLDGDKSQDNNEDEESPKGQDNHDGVENDGDERLDDDPINNDYEDNYEDKHQGIDVNNDDQEQNNMDGDEEDIDLKEDMDLDNGENTDEPGDKQDGSQLHEGQETEEPDEDGDVNNTEDDVMDVDNDEEAAEQSDGNEDNVENSHQTRGDDNQMNADGEDNDNDNMEEDKPQEEENVWNSSKERHQDAHGVAASNGPDSVQLQQDEISEEGEGNDNDEDQQHQGEGQADDKINNSGGGQSGTSSGDIQKGDQGTGNESNSASMDIPNPFRDPGDAERFWHRKLNVITDASDESPDQQENKESSKNENEDMNAEGDFEFTSREEEMSTQVLGKVMEEEAKLLNQEQEEESKSSHHQENKKNANQDPETMKRKASKDDKSLSKRSIEMTEEEEHDLSNIDDAEAKDDDDENDVEMEDDSTQSDQDELVDNNDTTDNLESKVITDLDQLKVREFDEENDFNPTCLVEEEIHHGGITHEQLEQARRKWSDLQSETVGLSRRLCEKLRLVMEPLVASKLRGDYRTGKRINMKRVIGYIASGYRKDKIWLRRTKPGKRDYRVLLAVDNSESMKNGAGDMALTAMATLANGMSQLEIGELGIASFGEEMKLLHPFNAPFTSSSGIDLVSNFTFADKRTRTALCVESALAALEAQTNSSSSMQLVFIISDGRIERDSRERLRRVVREMTEKNILLIMVVVEGDSNQGTKVKDSIVNMKEVSFENGKPKVKHFIDDYPFPYYMVLQDMHTLPEVLGDALKQWFEMMAHSQKPR